MDPKAGDSTKSDDDTPQTDHVRRRPCRKTNTVPVKSGV